MIKVTFTNPTIVQVPTNPNEPSEQIICGFVLCDELITIDVYSPETLPVSFGKKFVINGGWLEKIKSIEYVKPTDL